MTMGGIGGGQASSLVIQQTFVECLRPAGHRVKCQNLCLGLVLALSMVATSKPLITFYPMYVCLGYIFCVCGHVHMHVCVCMYVFVCQSW